jgi:hypothetical protein
MARVLGAHEGDRGGPRGLEMNLGATSWRKRQVLPKNLPRGDVSKKVPPSELCCLEITLAEW